MLKSKLSELTKEMKTQDTYQKKISPMHTPKKGHIQNSQRAEELSKLKNKTNGNKKWARFEYTLHTHTHCVVIQSLSCVQIFASPWSVTRKASLSFTIFWSLFKLMSIESVMLSNHLILSCRLLLLPSVFPSISVKLSNELAFRIR